MPSVKLWLEYQPPNYECESITADQHSITITACGSVTMASATQAGQLGRRATLRYHNYN